MRKLFLSLLLVLPLCGFAQKGMQGIGLGVEYGWGDNWKGDGGSLTSYGTSLKYEYNLTSRIRASANLHIMKVEGFNIYKPIVTENPTTPNRPYLLDENVVVYEIKDAYNTSKSVTSVGFNFHFFLNGVQRLRSYFILGGAIGVLENEREDIGPTACVATGARTGLGLNWRITYNWMFQLELSMMWMNMGYDYTWFDYSSTNGKVYYYNDVNKGYYDERLRIKDPNSNKYVTFDNYYSTLHLRHWEESDDSSWTSSSIYSCRYRTFTPAISVIYTF